MSFLSRRNRPAAPVAPAPCGPSGKPDPFQQAIACGFIDYGSEPSLFFGELLEKESRLYRAYCAKHAVPYVVILPHVVDVATFDGRKHAIDPYRCDIHATWEGCSWARRSCTIDSRSTRPGLDDRAVRDMGRLMERPMFAHGPGAGAAGCGAVWMIGEPDVFWRVEGVSNPPGKGRAGVVAFCIYEIIMSCRMRLTGVPFDRSAV